MEIPFRFQPASMPGKPWVLCIHGFGMSEKSWTDPCAEALLDGQLSFDWILTDLDHPPAARKGQALLANRLFLSQPLRLTNPPPDSFWLFLGKEGYGRVVWSQKKPAGSLALALEELQAILERLPAPDALVLLAHSRGGLIARKYLQERRPGWQRVKGVILLGAPHQGSRIATWARSWERGGLIPFLGKMALVPFRIIPFHPREGSPRLSFRSLRSYLQNPAIAELSPNSPLLREMARMESVEKENRIPYFNFIGLQTTYLRIYRQVRSGDAPMRSVFSLWEGLEKMIPRSLSPPEIQQGRGDGLVSAQSAHLSWAIHNQTFPLNHAQLLVAPSVHNRVLEILKAL